MLKYCLLAAGKGSRNTLYKNLHKALLPIGNKPVIDLILEKIPIGSEIIVALGYQKDQLKSILELYPYKWIFQEVEHEGIGSGPGSSLLQCQHHLDNEFIFFTVDTIFEKLPQGTNWAAFCARPNNNLYCNSQFEFDNISEQIFAGFAHTTPDIFPLLDQTPLTNGQKELVYALGKLNPTQIKVTCYDTGNNNSYFDTLKKLNQVPLKKHECTFLIQNKVIKFCEDTTLLNKYFVKYNEYPFCPTVKKLNTNMIMYNYIPGKLLSEITDINIFSMFIEKVLSTRLDGYISKSDLEEMYRLKTYSRIQDNYSFDNINGYPVLNLPDILSRIDWTIFDDYIPCLFHGDLQPENIVVNSELIFLDPRPSFGSSCIGDLYYELGKIYHACFINGEIIRQGLYGNNFHIKSNLLDLKFVLKKKCLEYGLNWSKVVLCGLLQYINIYSLYDDYRYREFLYKLGILKLSQYLNGDLDETFN